MPCMMERQCAPRASYYIGDNEWMIGIGRRTHPRNVADARPFTILQIILTSASNFSHPLSSTERTFWYGASSARKIIYGVDEGPHRAGLRSLTRGLKFDSGGENGVR